MDEGEYQEGEASILFHNQHMSFVVDFIFAFKDPVASHSVSNLMSRLLN